MYCISVSYKNTPADAREKFALTESGKYKLADGLRDIVSGCVILSTCNRTEVYFAGGKCGSALSQVENQFAAVAGISVSELRRCSMNYGEDCVFHLCRVACGMDSMVLGEVEIIRQIKDAYLMSKDAGMADSETNLVFQGALACAKSVATQGDAVRLPVSVGTLGAREAVRFCREKYADRYVAQSASCAEAGAEPGGSDSDAGMSYVCNSGMTCVGRILVVGATGRIGSIILKDIADMAPDIELVGTSRNHGRGADLFPADMRVKMCAYADRYALAEHSDVVISATSSSHYTFTADKLAGVFADNTADELTGVSAVNTADELTGRLFIDLAMPRDIDPKVAEIPGCMLRDIDYIDTLARENNESRRRSMHEMEPFVRRKADEITKNVIFSSFCRTHGELMERVRRDGADKIVYEMKEKLGSDAFEEMLDGLLSVYD